MFIVMLSAFVISFGISALSGLWLIPFLRRLKYGQTILDIGPNWHKKKQGTPTMGGIMFILGIILSVLCSMFFLLTQGSYDGTGFTRVLNARVLAGIVGASGYALIGFGDDYVKVSKKQNMGFSARQKLIMQLFISTIYLWWLYAAGDTATTVFVPFMGVINFGIFYWPLCVLGIIYIVNSVNLTDGLDGLAASVTAICGLGFFAVSVYMHIFQNAILSLATVGGCLAFLIYNAYPARVFMGDTGSMFLGGLVVAMAFGVRLPFFLAFFGIIYIVESMSVVLQVISFKTTGKRIFKMSPIHHHFEMCGFTERQIVLVFSLITVIGSLLGYLAAKLI